MSTENLTVVTLLQEEKWMAVDELACSILTIKIAEDDLALDMFACNKESPGILPITQRSLGKHSESL